MGKPREFDRNGHHIRYINVLHTERVPRPIFAAVFSGAPWRWLSFPDEVLRRSDEAQAGYVKWRCQHHYRETKGRCLLFGTIVGFEWVKAPSEIILLDTRGRVVGKAEKETPAGHGSLTIGNKTIPGSMLG